MRREIEMLQNQNQISKLESDVPKNSLPDRGESNDVLPYQDLQSSTDLQSTPMVESDFNTSNPWPPKAFAIEPQSIDGIYIEDFKISDCFAL